MVKKEREPNNLDTIIQNQVLHVLIKYWNVKCATLFLFIFSLYHWSRCQLFLTFCERHILSWRQLDGLPLPVVSGVQGLPAKTTQKRKQCNTESANLCISWNNFSLEKNPIVDPGVKPVVSWQPRHHWAAELLYNFLERLLEFLIR